MKIFDCSKCKNKQNEFMHCLFYQNEPDIEVCSGYQKSVDNEAIVAQNIEKTMKRKAIDLVNTFQGLEYNFHNWFDIIKSASSNIHDYRTAVRFIRSFGDGGINFACERCGNIVELDDDSDVFCPECHGSDLVFVSV